MTLVEGFAQSEEGQDLAIVLFCESEVQSLFNFII